MEFLFECSTWDIKLNTRREIPYLQAAMYYCLLYKHTLYKHTNVDFFDDFPKVFQKLSEGGRIVSEHFPKITEDFRGISLVFIS